MEEKLNPFIEEYSDDFLENKLLYFTLSVKNFITKYSSISARVLCYASFFNFSIILLFSSITPS